MLSRRTLLAAAPTLAAAGTVAPSAFAQAQQPAAPAASGSAQAPGFYRYKVGDVEVTAILDGAFPFKLEGFVRNAELSDVQRAAQEAFQPSGQLIIPITTLVLRQGDRITLVDTGRGEGGPNWMANFRAAGFDPAKVNSIVISHFHGDHIGGIRGKDGKLTFANAEIMVPKNEWAFWMDDARMNQAPEAMRGGFQNARNAFGPIANDVKQYEWGKELVPGLTSVEAPGHTPGHTAYMLSSGQSRFMIMSDTANHPALFVRNPDWAAVFDMDGDRARESRRKLLEMAASERAQVAFYHAPFPATGHILKEGNGYRFVPLQWSQGL